MPEQLSTQSLRSAFVFPFQSKDWISRFVIGVVLLFVSMIIPVIPAIFVYGYMIEVMRQSILSESLVLPEWANWGRLFKDGLRSLAVILVFLGPAIVISILGILIYFTTVVGSIALTPDPSSSSALEGYTVLLMMGGMGVFFLSMFVSWFLLFAGAVPLPAAIAHFTARDKLSAAFHVREWTALICADKLGYFIAWVTVLGLISLIYLGFMLVYFTFIFCFAAYFIAIPVGFYLMLVSTAIFGQFYKENAGEVNIEAAGRSTGI